MTKFSFWSEYLSPGALPVYETGGADALFFDDGEIVRTSGQRRLIVPEFEVSSESSAATTHQVLDMARRLMLSVGDEGLKPGTILLPNRGVTRLSSTAGFLYTVNLGMAHVSDVRLEKENTGDFDFPSPLGLEDLDHVQDLLRVKDVMTS